MFLRVLPGQRRVVSLPGGQQQVLDGIEADLEEGEPQLTSMFAIFTRLTQDDGAPRTEALGPEGWLTRSVRTIIAVPLILGLVALAVLMAAGSGTRGCRPAAGTPAAARTASCQSAQEPLSRP
jgi:hypothetical protein